MHLYHIVYGKTVCEELHWVNLDDRNCL